MDHTHSLQGMLVGQMSSVGKEYQQDMDWLQGFDKGRNTLLGTAQQLILRLSKGSLLHKDLAGKLDMCKKSQQDSLLLWRN